VGIDVDVGKEDYPRVPWEPLQAFVARCFEGLGMPETDAAMEAEVLVWANLRGIDSHGVQRVEEYAGRVDAGIMNPRPNIKVEKETAAILRIEADFAFGPVVTIPAMEKTIGRAGGRRRRRRTPPDWSISPCYSPNQRSWRRGAGCWTRPAMHQDGQKAGGLCATRRAMACYSGRLESGGLR
jgi:hypothetical protein